MSTKPCFLRWLIGLLPLLLCVFCSPALAKDELDEGVKVLLTKLDEEAPGFLNPDADLILSVQGRDGTANRLAALVERALRHHLEPHLGSITTANTTGLADPRRADSWLALDHQGYDRLLNLQVLTDANHLILQTQVVMLANNAWISSNTQARYAQHRFRLVVPGKASFALFERELDELGPILLPWQAQAVAVTEGEALDLAVVKGADGGETLVLLLADRLEIHSLLATDDAPLLIPLPERSRSEAHPRVAFGHVFSCGTQAPAPLFISLAGSTQGLRLRLDDGNPALEVLDRLPLACRNQTQVVTAPYLEGSLLRDTSLASLDDSAKPLASTDRPFLDYLPDPEGGQGYWLDYRGSLYNHNGVLEDLSCGQHPAFVCGLSGVWLLACSQGLAQPDHDGVRLFQLDRMANKALANGAVRPGAGRINALCSSPSGPAQLFGIRYVPEKNLSIVERMQP